MTLNNAALARDRAHRRMAGSAVVAVGWGRGRHRVGVVGASWEDFISRLAHRNAASTGSRRRSSMRSWVGAIVLVVLIRLIDAARRGDSKRGRAAIHEEPRVRNPCGPSERETGPQQNSARPALKKPSPGTEAFRCRRRECAR